MLKTTLILSPIDKTLKAYIQKQKAACLPKEDALKKKFFKRRNVEIEK